MSLADTQPAPPELPWFAWAVRSTPRGWEWVRLLLPTAVVEEHAVGDIAAPDTRAIMCARLENDLRSDRLSDRRGWDR